MFDGVTDDPRKLLSYILAGALYIAFISFLGSGCFQY